MELRLVPMRVCRVENPLGSWTNSRVASLGLASTEASSMERRCAGCSVERFAGRIRQNTSARIMIRSIDFTNGKLTFV